MWRWLARLGMGSCFLAMLLSTCTSHVARLRASERGIQTVTDDNGRANHCRGDAVAYAYHYVDDMVYDSAGDVLDQYGFVDYQSCQSAIQTMAITVAGRSCTGVSHGTYGIAYSRTQWDAFWNDVFVEAVGPQQYECGDVSVY